MSESSEKCLKSYFIPAEVDTVEGRRALREKYRSPHIANHGCPRLVMQGQTKSWTCGAESCAQCICGTSAFRDDWILKREAFIDYDLRHPVECKSGAPELRPGMIIHTSKGHYYLVVVGRKDDVVAYRCSLTFGSLFIADAASFRADDSDIDAVYDEEGVHWFMPAALVDILRGSERHRIWKRPDPVKEMTVDEISEALGYKVKVVGSEKADN